MATGYDEAQDLQSGIHTLLYSSDPPADEPLGLYHTFARHLFEHVCQLL
jgi:hypothetical protein